AALAARDAADELAGGALERGEGRRRVRRLDAGPLVAAVAGALHQPELLDIARNRGLGRVEAALLQPAPQHFLAVQRLAIDQIQNHSLPACFHRQFFTTENAEDRRFDPEGLNVWLRRSTGLRLRVRASSVVCSGHREYT